MNKWKYQYSVITLCILAYFATRMGQVAISPLIPAITETFEISKGAIGMALSGMWVAYAVSQYPSGILATHFGERHMIIITLSLTAGCILLIISSFSFLFLFASIVLLGGFVGLYYNVAVSLLSRHFDNLGQAIGIHRIGGPLAGFITPSVVAILSVRYGWRFSLLFVLFTIVLVLFLFFWQIDPIPPLGSEQRLRDEIQFATILNLITQREIFLFVLIAGLAEFVVIGSISFLPTFLIEYRNLSVEYASFLFSVYFAVSVGIHPITGWVSDRWSKNITGIGTLIVGAVGYIFLLETTWSPLFIGIIFTGITVGWNAPLQAEVMTILNQSQQGHGFGLFRMCYVLIAATGSVVTGTLADIQGWFIAFVLLAGLLVVAVFLLVIYRFTN